MSHNRLLIVHPDASACSLLRSMLQTMGHRIDEVSSDRAAVRTMESAPADVVLAAVDPHDSDSLELLSYLRRKFPRVPVILLFAQPHAERCREATIRGASAVLRLPLMATQLRAAVAQVLGEPDPAPAGSCSRPASRLPGENGENGHASAGNGMVHHGIDGNLVPRLETASVWSPEPPAPVGDDPRLRQAVELARSIAPTRAPVLIVGERGTGKAMIARFLHSRSPRRDRPFIEVDCAALGDGAEAELFGQRHAVAGADGRPGKIAQAYGGTLFISEVASLSPALQFRLLRLLQDGRYEPAGSGETLQADVRILLATHEDLAARVEQGLFREDLYYRISIVTLSLAPLRQRGPDIERLAEHFRAGFTREIGKPVVGFTADALEMLRCHPWAGNVLELENVVERAVILCRGPRIEPGHLELHHRRDPLPAWNGHAASTQRASAPQAPIIPLKEALEEPEKQLILQALEALNWNRQETARMLDINRTTLYKKMKKYNLLIEEPIGVH